MEKAIDEEGTGRLVQLVLMGSPPIGTSTMTFTSSGGLFPILIASIRMKRSRCCQAHYNDVCFQRATQNTWQSTGNPGGHVPAV